ncbi:hypothetical protein YTPLAS18_39330 [Nitrospira sp.]|nr:hypothetical protein YTPLAS18_39330 [Nitrospira sp.]
MFMKQLRYPVVAAVLAACVLFTAGVVSVEAVGHADQHAHHHNAHMHSSALCAWMCAAGQGIEVSETGFGNPILILESAGTWQASSPNLVLATDSRSRAPPSRINLS